MEISEVAVALGRSVSWVQKRLQARQLRSSRPGGRGQPLIRREWLYAFLDAFAQGGP